MSLSDWEYSEWDAELFATELNSFVPDYIYDAHAHLYHLSHFPPGAASKFLSAGPVCAGLSEFRARMDQITPGRTMDGLFFGYPHAAIDVESENQFVAAEVGKCGTSHAQMLTPPQMTSEQIHQAVTSLGFSGLKCYHVWSQHQPTFDSKIEDFLPEHHVRAADELELSITLHMVRSRALADPVNQATIRRYCETYPRMKLILAHAARGFNPHHTILGIHSLRGLENVWFDTSAVTDCGAMEAIIRVMGHERLLYGSDFPVSHLRGRCVGLGDSFLWISASNTELNVPYANLELALVGHESLRALKVAAMSTGLSDSQVEDIFSGNARRLK